jgi:hypothetical protein
LGGRIRIRKRKGCGQKPEGQRAKFLEEESMCAGSTSFRVSGGSDAEVI